MVAAVLLLKKASVQTNQAYFRQWLPRFLNRYKETAFFQKTEIRLEMEVTPRTELYLIAFMI